MEKASRTTHVLCAAPAYLLCLHIRIFIAVFIHGFRGNVDCSIIPCYYAIFHFRFFENLFVLQWLKCRKCKQLRGIVQAFFTRSEGDNHYHIVQRFDRLHSGNLHLCAGLGYVIFTLVQFLHFHRLHAHSITTSTRHIKHRTNYSINSYKEIPPPKVDGGTGTKSYQLTDNLNIRNTQLCSATKGRCSIVLYFNGYDNFLCTNGDIQCLCI